MGSDGLAERLLAVSAKVRYILALDENGEVIFCRTTERSLVNYSDADALAKDVHFLKGLLRVYDDVAGRNLFTHLIREKGHILMFYPGDWVFLVSCDGMERTEAAAAADEMEGIIREGLPSLKDR